MEDFQRDVQAALSQILAALQQTDAKLAKLQQGQEELWLAVTEQGKARERRSSIATTAGASEEDGDQTMEAPQEEPCERQTMAEGMAEANPEASGSEGPQPGESPERSDEETHSSERRSAAADATAPSSASRSLHDEEEALPAEVASESEFAGQPLENDDDGDSYGYEANMQVYFDTDTEASEVHAEAASNVSGDDEDEEILFLGPVLLHVQEPPMPPVLPPGDVVEPIIPDQPWDAEEGGEEEWEEEEEPEAPGADVYNAFGPFVAGGPAWAPTPDGPAGAETWYGDEVPDWEREEPEEYWEEDDYEGWEGEEEEEEYFEEDEVDVWEDEHRWK